MRRYKAESLKLSEEELFIVVNGGMNAVFALRDELREIRDKSPAWGVAIRRIGDELPIQTAVGDLVALRNKVTHDGALRFGERSEWIDTEHDGQVEFIYPTVVLGKGEKRVTHTAQSFFEEIELAALWWRDHLLALGDSYEHVTGSRKGIFDKTPYWLSDNESLSIPVPFAIPVKEPEWD